MKPIILSIALLLAGCKVTELPDGTRIKETDAALAAKVLDAYIAVKAAKVEATK